MDSKIMLDYIEAQKKTFELLEKTCPSDFNNGVMQGLNLVKMFVISMDLGKGGTL